MPLVSSCSFSDKVNDAADKIRSAEALLARDPSARTSAEPDDWCSSGNVRGTDVCFDGNRFFVRVTGPFISMDGWFLSKQTANAAPTPGWPRDRGEPDHIESRQRPVVLNRGWGLYFMDD